MSGRSAPSELSLVVFDLPLEPLYGGTLEVAGRIKALLVRGIRIHLHVLVHPDLHQQLRSGALAAPDWVVQLAGFHTYPRRLALQWWSLTPHAVTSRNSEDLIRQLAQGPDHILVEGWQCTGFLGHTLLDSKKVWIRSHNRESTYYLLQSDCASTLWKRWYYRAEAYKWSLYERSLLRRCRPSVQGVWSICPHETEEWTREGWPARYLPPFVPVEDRANDGAAIQGHLPDRPYVMYHGRMDIPENARALHELTQGLFGKQGIPWVVAGSRLNFSQKQRLGQIPGGLVEEQPDALRMQALVQGAAVHCIPSYGRAGVRLKTIHAMYSDAHVLVRAAAGRGLPWESWLTLVPEDQDWLPWVDKALRTPPDSAWTAARREWLRGHFDPDRCTVRMLEAMGLQGKTETRAGLAAQSPEVFS